jgi:hypothetical protein
MFQVTLVTESPTSRDRNFSPLTGSSQVVKPHDLCLPTKASAAKEGTNARKFCCLLRLDPNANPFEEIRRQAEPVRLRVGRKCEPRNGDLKQQT